MRRTIIPALAALTLAGGPALAETYRPEVLLMRSFDDGARKSYEHARFSPVSTTGRPASATFQYRADADVVRCTVKPGAPDAAGRVTATVQLQRETEDAAGNKNLTTTSQQFTFTPGEPLIVATAPHLGPGKKDHSVELLQLTMTK